MTEIRNFLVKEDRNIKETMNAIDKGGLGIAFVTDDQDVLKGTITDGDIRKALRKGLDINSSIYEVMNRNPIKISIGEGEKEILNQIDKREKKFFKFYSLKIPIIDENKKITDIAVYSINSRNLYFLNKNQDLIKEDIRTILVVGGAGYLGSVLCRKLLERGFSVKVLDILTFGEEPLLGIKNHPNLELIHGDIRNIETINKSLSEIDAVIHLAAIVGDPASQNQPSDTIETNYLATMTLAQACKYHQINRFVFASTCSVYGKGNQILDEKAELNPVSLYARSKIESEKGILSLSDENFSPTILRMGTLYGLSPRMRFDLVVNIFSKMAAIEKKINIFGGTQWRPLLHVEDAAEAFIKSIEAPIEKIRCQVFNVGADQQNYQIQEIGSMVKEILPETVVHITQKEELGGKEDQRDYKVSFEKIERELGFKPKRQVKEAVLEIKEAIQNGRITDVSNRKYYNS